MKVRFKGIYPRNKNVDEDLKGRTFDIGTIYAGVSLSDDGLTIMISDTKLSSFLKNEFSLRKFKGILKK